jgi:hypothetical protein
LSSLFFKSGSLIHRNIITESSRAKKGTTITTTPTIATPLTTTTSAKKETQELKAKKNLSLSALSDREQLF